MGKKNNFNYTRNRKKLRHKEKAKIRIKNPIIKSAWNHEVSMKSNFDRLGISYDPNNVLKISSRSFFKGEADKIPRLHKKTRVVEALEEAAKHAKVKPIYVSEDDQLFCMYNLEMHGDDFLAMSRDPKNMYQLTPKQLEHSIAKFKQTPRYSAYLKEKEAGTFDITAFYDIGTD
ncbi:unnamed protein product [Calicophoron daubneyi]|uniref:Nucleolar protein 16 n=1 Tax=Calicophoron daubneyi TaxID=300641 RepID=A0AAV2SZT5_CALDB